jgi:hypothetical protein
MLTKLAELKRFNEFIYRLVIVTIIHSGITLILMIGFWTGITGRI